MDLWDTYSTTWPLYRKASQPSWRTSLSGRVRRYNLKSFCTFCSQYWRNVICFDIKSIFSNAFYLSLFCAHCVSSGWLLQQIPIHTVLLLLSASTWLGDERCSAQAYSETIFHSNGSNNCSSISKIDSDELFVLLIIIYKKSLLLLLLLLLFLSSSALLPGMRPAEADCWQPIHKIFLHPLDTGNYNCWRLCLSVVQPVEINIFDNFNDPTFSA